MLSNRLLSALAAVASIAGMAVAQSPTTSSILFIPTPTSTPKANAMTSVGCFKAGAPLEDHGAGYFTTSGSCQLICLGLNQDVLGLSDGTHCWCGMQFPALSAQVSNDSCSTPCGGFKDAKCGGKDLVWVMTTGNTPNPIDYYDPPVSSSTSTSRATSQASQAVGSAYASNSPVSNSSGGTSKVGIAVGVVVGVIVLALVSGGIVFFMRRQKKRELEKEHRRQAAASSFVNGGRLHTSNSSMNDSRLDPDFMHRRQSNGSIADNEDYSRRILKVTNV